MNLPAEVSIYDRLRHSDAELCALLAAGAARHELAAMLGREDHALFSTLARRALQRTARRPGSVYLLPGIMGTQLGAARAAPLPADLLWVDPQDIMAGGLERLRLDAPPLLTLGAIPYSYLPLQLRLSAAGFHVIVHEYDWRADLIALAADLAARLRADHSGTIAIVAHSMGGLVARRALAEPGLEHVRQLITLGTPHRGSYGAVQALRGTYPVVRRLAALDRMHDAEFLSAQVFSTFPSIYQLLPASASPALLTLDGWPGSGPRPDPQRLGAVRHYIATLPVADARCVAIAGTHHRTVTGLRLEADDFRYEISDGGDGTVPLASAQWPGCANYFVRCEHSALPRSATVARALCELLRHGRTQRLASHPGPPLGRPVTVSDTQLRGTWREKVDWLRLAPAARRAYLNGLNQPPAQYAARRGGAPTVNAMRGTGTPASLVWFRQDLRLDDNPALLAAQQRGGPVIPVYLDSGLEEGEWSPGAASRWWRHHSLDALEARLRERGSRLTLRRGPALATLQRLCAETGADAVYWNRRYEPDAMARDTAVKQALRSQGLVAESRNSALLAEPWQVATQSGGPFQVFTPFWRRILLEPDPPPPQPAPTRLTAPPAWPVSEPLAALGMLPRLGWDAGLAAAWRPGESGATRRLDRFIEVSFGAYADQRDLPAVPATSRLSPHLHHGELGPRQVWHAIVRAARERGLGAAEARSGKFLAELGWREFSHHLLFHFPHTATEPLRAAFARFPWRDDPEALRAWQRGRTGVPLVDAGMRELWTTGWMHNRVRMIVASFLVKNLRQHWLRGARWFWDTLVDADLAANTQGWQWTAGCGADAAPYFRVFNPVTQSRRFDPQGVYLRRWLPELARLDERCIHAPWLATAASLAAAGPRLGSDYPHPIVDLSASRSAALSAWQQLRR